uniref:Uncharacterized protein n=1 Tax=virus sp. ctx9V1 TaxID=2828001 RepID=A0A8S5RCP7_9VIRU|nr:MAG TPA: hypothetical protein [virus sp. ctx9V1]
MFHSIYLEGDIQLGLAYRKTSLILHSDMRIMLTKSKERYLPKVSLESKLLLLKPERTYIEPIQISCIRRTIFLE